MYLTDFGSVHGYRFVFVLTFRCPDFRKKSFLFMAHAILFWRENSPNWKKKIINTVVKECHDIRNHFVNSTHGSP